MDSIEKFKLDIYKECHRKMFKQIIKFHLKEKHEEQLIFKCFECGDNCSRILYKYLFEQDNNTLVNEFLFLNGTINSYDFRI